MKCSDLQIGDYVLVKPSMILIKVTAVHKNKVGYHAVTHKLNWVRIDLLEPIPLTFEILELNGFHHEDFGYSIVTTDDKSFLLLGVFSGGTYLWHEAKIYYVHELQHALRLCSLNDLADNLKLEDSDETRR